MKFALCLFSFAEIEVADPSFFSLSPVAVNRQPIPALACIYQLRARGFSLHLLSIDR